MKMHKQLFNTLLIGVFLLAATAVFGQPGHHGHHPPGMKQGPMFSIGDLMEMKTELQLTDEQMGQLGELNTAFEQDLQKLKGQDFESGEDHREAFHNLATEYKGKLGQVLTEEQLAKLEAIKAERRARHKEYMDNVDKDGLRSELNAYHEKNIRPVMQQQRAKLDEKISAEDKTLISELRTKFEANRQEMQQLKDSPEHSRDDFKAMREEHKDEMEALKGLVEKYSEDIDAVLAEVEGQQEQWHKDMRAIHEKYAPNPEEGHRRGKDGKKGKGEKQMRRPGHPPHPGPGMPPHGKDMRKGHFLLLDPNAPAETSMEGAVTTNVKVYPNPAANRMTLEYTLLKAGNVRIELRDKEGNLTKVVEEGQKTAGDYSLPVDATSLQDGVYYLTIVSQGQQTATKVVVAKQ
ncbi:MAG: T9SS type A sorting domain-containing protein [Phaeodactylibacter sp.]|nr:T9SS type A sorting domain-containing protein [Phaeodactylibacter sp.]MCB9263839.1 T9SS type A sorting domain-containing protein [Lewinellaceae bacterium]MCB9288239.1 T9SS type A sorting domain-containing protein [Lewinellaceae bacterium]